MLDNGTLLQERYRIVRLLAHGGMGAVYEAEAVHLGNAQVAVKQTFYNEQQRTMREQFEREAATMARLRHPALPRVSDHFVEGGGQFLVMEFVPGADLLSLLNRRGQPFECRRVIAWAETLLDALNYIHTQYPPVIHRDIKPQNLKLTPRGELFLIDFGLAKNGATPTHSSASLHAYTLSYAPPEQIKGAGTDPRSDLYSLGATLHHLLAGEPPIDSRVREEVMRYQAPDPLRLLHQIDPQIPPAVALVIARSLALDREARYASAAAMLQALRESGSLIATIAPETPSSRPPQTQEERRLPSQSSPSESAAERLPLAPSREQSRQIAPERPSRLGESKRHAGFAPVPATLNATKAIIIGAALALPVAALAVYFAFIAGRSSGGPVIKSNGIVIPGSGVTEVQGNVKLPTGVAPPGSIGNFSFETVILDKNGNAQSRQKKQARHFGEDLGGDVIMELVEIPGGEFTMGSPKEEESRIPNEGPQRRVTLPSFWMGKYEITQEQWREVAKLPIVKSDFDPDPSFPLYKHGKTPVSGVSWEDAVEFCKRLSRKTGREYRLPSEAEWEYAARAGTATPFAFGPTITPVVANCFQKRPMTIGSLGVANAFGLFDMHGNVWEWCQDERHDDYEDLSANGSWKKEGDQRFRTLRGGCWGLTEIKLCRSALRYQDAPEARSLIYGFRVITSAVAR
ncbi:MAG TPA: bifunctional serine/threonine-protein kinase/formylglycine-generating enzyme family protein [Blastocatellia bacterium]|nr:bifunctional serine/threonine-protein kinase/formylglycine-generating enzyme family protein [Blastocatellia bacterium]